MTQTMIDCTGAALPGLLAAIGPRYPDVLAGYVTGTGGVDWPGHYWAELAGHAGLFRYDQSAGLPLFASGAADCADIERDAADLGHAVAATKAREARGWWSWWYFSAGQLAAARAAVQAAGFRKVRFGVADWDLSRDQAVSMLEDNRDVNFVQWASPSSNPSTVCPGTVPARSLADLNVDLNVTVDAWFRPAAANPLPRRLSKVVVGFSDGTSVTY